MVWVLQQFTSVSQERIVDAPGIYADPFEPRLVEFLKRPSHFPPQARNVPVQRACVGYGLVCESMHFLCLDYACAEMCYNCAAAFRPKIESKVRFGWTNTRHKKRRFASSVLFAPW